MKWKNSFFELTIHNTKTLGFHLTVIIGSILILIIAKQVPVKILALAITCLDLLAVIYTIVTTSEFSSDTSSSSKESSKPKSKPKPKTENQKPKEITNKVGTPEPNKVESKELNNNSSEDSKEVKAPTPPVEGARPLVNISSEAFDDLWNS